MEQSLKMEAIVADAEVHYLEGERENREREKTRRMLETRRPAVKVDLLPHREIGYCISFKQGYFPDEDEIEIYISNNPKNFTELILELKMNKEQWDLLQKKVNDSFARRRSVDQSQ